MNINVVNFKDVLKKATLNFSIGSVQLVFEDGKIKSSMISESRNAIVVIHVDNDVISGDGVEFNFSSPSENLVPFLNLVDEEEVDIEIRTEKIVMRDGRQKQSIHFCSPTIVSTFGSRAAREGTTYFTAIEIDGRFVDMFSKIKKIGSRFGKIYFTVDNGKLFIETTDKTNRFSNNLKFELMSVGSDDLTMCFDYTDFSNLMSVIGNREDFKMHFAYVEDQEMGMIYITSSDDSENYYLMSKEL